MLGEVLDGAGAGAEIIVYIGDVFGGILSIPSIEVCKSVGLTSPPER